MAGVAAHGPGANAALVRALLDDGANGVDEVSRADWEKLACWSLLRAYEQRRFLAAL